MRDWLTVRRIMVAGAALAVGLGGWAASNQAARPARPIAAWLMVDPPAPLDGEGGAGWQSRLVSWRKTQAALVASPNVLAAAVRQLTAQRPALVTGQADPAAWLQDGIRVDDLSDAIFTISMPGESREDQAAIVNAVAEAYLAATGSWESARRGQKGDAADAALAAHWQRPAAQRKALRGANDADLEPLAALRDEVAILEGMTRRLALAAEEARRGSQDSPTVRLVAEARP